MVMYNQQCKFESGLRHFQKSKCTVENGTELNLNELHTYVTSCD